VAFLFLIAALVGGAAISPAGRQAEAYPTGAQIRFEEVAQKAGLRFQLRNGAGLPWLRKRGP